MENSQIQKEIIELGKLLVKQLKIEDSVDTLGRWMAHYISEKIKEAEYATGKKKVAAEKLCFEIILEVWNHRWEMQDNHRPFINFERILQVIQSIDPEAQKSYFYFDEYDEPKKGDSPWMIAAFEVDKAARVCLEYILSKAAEEAKTDDTANWLHASEKLSSGADMTVLRTLLDKNSASFDQNLEFFPKDSLSSDYQIEYIKNRISELDNLEKHVKKIKNGLKAELKTLPKSSHNS